jgi:hypothetical protein
MEDNADNDVMANDGLGERVNTALPLLTGRQRAIVTGVLADQRHLSALPVGADAALSRDQLGRRRIIVRDAQAGLVPMNLGGWLGRAPSNSDCVLCCREYARLEDMGLLERHNLRGGRRTSHLKLTPAGRWVAEALLAEDASTAVDAGDQVAAPFDLADLDMSSITLPPELETIEHDAQ